MPEVPITLDPIRNESFVLAQVLRELSDLDNAINLHIKELKRIYFKNLKKPGIIILSATVGIGWVEYDNVHGERTRSTDMNSLPGTLRKNNFGIFSLADLDPNEFVPRDGHPILDQVAQAIDFESFTSMFKFPESMMNYLEFIVSKSPEELKSIAEELLLMKGDIHRNALCLENLDYFLSLIQFHYILLRKMRNLMFTLRNKYPFYKGCVLPYYMESEDGIYFYCYDIDQGYQRYFFFNLTAKGRLDAIKAYLKVKSEMHIHRNDIQNTPAINIIGEICKEIKRYFNM